jgi:hypothetical protein
MKRLYVLIDNKLDKIYGCVQAGHAVAQYLLEDKNNNWHNDYLIYLSADINEWKNKLNNKNIEYTEFKEPDLNNETTAIAVLNNGKLFKKLKLIA